MLKITIPSVESYDEVKNKFTTSKEQVLLLEHSLVSISKWESITHRPFLSGVKTIEETIEYIKCMTTNQVLDESVYMNLTNGNLEEVSKYVEDPMTATFVSKKNKPGQKEIITSELIYYWMITLQIPFECQKWHLNRLLMLINVCNVKNQKPEKLSKREALSRNAKLNAERKAKMGTKG